jgi:hypothetical protein
MRISGLLLLSAAYLGTAIGAQAQPVSPTIQDSADRLSAATNLFKGVTGGPELGSRYTCPDNKKKSAIREKMVQFLLDRPEAYKSDRMVEMRKKHGSDEAYLRNLPDNVLENKAVSGGWQGGSLGFTPCTPYPPTTVKFSAPFNPDYETNVLKSGTNIHPDSSYGLGGSALVVMSGLNPYDLMAAGIASASSRYHDFPTKNLDVVTTQAAYQLFLGAKAYNEDGSTLHITGATDPHKIPQSPNLSQVDTFAFGFTNQSNYTPTFQTKTADLFTPQASLTRQNISLLVKVPWNVCAP